MCVILKFDNKNKREEKESFYYGTNNIIISQQAEIIDINEEREKRQEDKQCMIF